MVLTIHLCKGWFLSLVLAFITNVRSLGEKINFVTHMFLFSLFWLSRFKQAMSITLPYIRFTDFSYSPPS